MALALLATACARSAEKLYGGRSLGAWQADLVDFDVEASSAATAVPALVEILSDETIDEATRRSAALVLSRIGAPARPAVPVLVRLLQGDTQRPQEAPLWAAKALAQFGAVARDAAPAVATVLRDERRPLNQRQMCLEALAVIRGAHPDAVGAIIDAVNNEAAGDDEDAAQLRSLAVEALGVAGPDAAVAAPLLARIVRNPRETEAIRRRSVIALGAMGPSAAIAVEPLAEALVIDQSEAVRDDAAQSLASLGPQGQGALLQFLRHDDASLRWRAAQALGGIPKPEENIIVALQIATRDPDEQVRLHAADSLWKIIAEAEPILSTVVQLLTSDDRNIRFGALALLESFGPQAKSAVAPLEELTADKRQYVRRAAETALRNLRQQKSPSPRGRGPG